MQEVKKVMDPTVHHSDRKLLARAISEILVPRFVARGFRQVPLSPEEKKSELGTAFPFGKLRRELGQVVHLVDIQLAPHDEAAFRVAAGVAPVDGIDHEIAGRILTVDLFASQLRTHWVAKPRFGNWFAVGRWSRRSIGAKEIERFVAEKSDLVVPEVEAALMEARTGKHLKRYG
jgi:hypothetical protein